MKITIIYNNCEVVRDEVTEDMNLVELMKAYYSELTNARLRPDGGQVTVWVGDTHLYIAYRKLDNCDIEITVMKNYEVFNLVYHEDEVYAEDPDGCGFRMETFGDFTKMCGIYNV